MKRAIWLLFVLASTMAVGCGASEPSSESNTPALQSNEYATPEVGERSDLRDARYCEVIVVTGRLNDIEGAVYNTIGLNDCPTEQWEVLDPEQLKEEFRVNEIVLNGPRYFMMDENALAEPGEVASFGGLQMRHLATIQLPAGSLIGDNLEGQPYTENTIERETEYVFRARPAGLRTGYSGRAGLRDAKLFPDRGPDPYARRPAVFGRQARSPTGLAVPRSLAGRGLHRPNGWGTDTRHPKRPQEHLSARRRVSAAVFPPARESREYPGREGVEDDAAPSNSCYGVIIGMLRRYHRDPKRTTGGTTTAMSSHEGHSDSGLQ